RVDGVQRTAVRATVIMAGSAGDLSIATCLHVPEQGLAEEDCGGLVADVAPCGLWDRHLTERHQTTVGPGCPGAEPRHGQAQRHDAYPNNTSTCLWLHCFLPYCPKCDDEIMRSITPEGLPPLRLRNGCAAEAQGRSGRHEHWRKKKAQPATLPLGGDRLRQQHRTASCNWAHVYAMIGYSMRVSLVVEKAGD